MEKTTVTQSVPNPTEGGMESAGWSIAEVKKPPTAYDRLYKNTQKVKVEKTANDALLTTLSAQTLRFLKKRRKATSFEKVPLTYYRERQLRAIFNGLDFDKMGTIHLDLVKDAANYAEEKLKPKKGEPVFKNIQLMFEAMDEDGDGTVDFHEFTIAMTGSAKSTVDSASEYDVDRLTKRFIEFANIRRRERALDVISSVMTGEGNTAEANPETGASAVEALNEAVTEEDSVQEIKRQEQMSFDAAKIEHFRTCFAVFNSRVTDDTVESEIDAYYTAKGIKRYAKDGKKGTIGANTKPMNTTASTVGPVTATITPSVPDFKVKNVKTQEVLDFFLTDVSNFIETEESPAFCAKAKEQIAEKLAKEEAAKAKLLDSPPDSKNEEKEEVDDDVPIGLVIENLTPLQEREKREREFVEIQKRRASERAKEAEEAMVDLDKVEQNERLRAEKIYVLNIKKKPWVPKPATGGIPKWSGPNKVPTLVPVSVDKVLRTEMRMRVKTRREIAALKAKRQADDKERESRALSEHLHLEDLAYEEKELNLYRGGGSHASIGEDSSTIYIEKPKRRNVPPAHGIVIRFGANTKQ